MDLGKTPGLLEYALFGAFIILYAAYLVRMIMVARQVNSSSRGVFVKLTLRAVYFLMLLIALLAPSCGVKAKKEVKTIGKDIFFAVDLSKSMDGTDIIPSRLEKVKMELKKIVKEFSSDRLGLIIFSSDAFVQCPLTYDATAMFMFIETLNTNLISSAGTDFAPALRMALEKHSREEEGKSLSQQSKVVILVSDGEDFGDETTKIANQIRDAGIKVFTLGVGTEAGSKIPQGYKFKRDKDGNDVVTTLNATAMQKLAAATSGSYFELSDRTNDISRLINEINKIEGELRDTAETDISANKYYYFLLIALVLMGLDVLFTVKVIKL